MPSAFLVVDLFDKHADLRVGFDREAELCAVAREHARGGWAVV